MKEPKIMEEDEFNKMYQAGINKRNKISFDFTFEQVLLYVRSAIVIAVGGVVILTLYRVVF